MNNPFDPLPGEGGRPLRYGLLCRALVEAGHEVLWWSSDFHHLTKARRALSPVYGAEGFQVRLVPTVPYAANVGLRRWRSHRRYAADWGRLARLGVERQGLARPDLIVVSMPPLGLFDEAASLRAAWGCKVLVDIQDAWPESFYQLLPAPLRGLGRGVFSGAHRLAARAYRGADAVSAVCERYAGLAQSCGCSTRPRVFRLGCPLPRHPVGERVGGVLRLCYVGNLGASYDLRTLVAGVCALASEGMKIAVEVAGDGPQRGWIERAAAEPGSPVIFRGYLGEEPLAACLRACEVGVVPMVGASWVAVPNKVTDYAAAGLAMINGLEGETQDLLREYDAGIAYVPGNTESFKRAVLRYASDRALLHRHQAGARRLAEALFDPEKIYPAMAEWVGSCAGTVLKD